MVEYLNVLLANFVYLQYKIHSLHTDCIGALFLPYHSFLDEVYGFFGDSNIDTIKERVRILGEDTPNTLEELTKLNTVEELKSIPSITEALKIVKKDLEDMCELLQKGEEQADDMKDFVTMNMLTDFHKIVGKLERKNRSILGLR